MPFNQWLCGSLCALMLASEVAGQTLVAQLDYGTFAGAFSSRYNISYWQKIPFAAPPIGQNRFRGPQPPIPITNGTYDSSQFYDLCPQRTVNGSEDCLYLGLYSRPWTKGQPLRPVVVNYFGGAFIQGGSYFTIPPAGYPTLNVSDANDFIFVEPNYRTNAFGFLPGKEIGNDPSSDLNPGLLDQHFGLQWVNKYIAQFGGDPNNVAIWGQSAGAGSVVAQVIAQNGQTTPRLFNKALASSPFWPKTYNYDAPQAQDVYDSFANMAGCSGPNSLQCLKTVDVQTLRDAAAAIAGSHTYNTSSYTWAPVIDGTFLTEPLSNATSRGAVNIDYGFGVYNQHEGENFIAPGLQGATNTGSPPFNSSIASFRHYVSGFLPGLTAQDLHKLELVYPEVGTSEALAGGYSSNYIRAGLIYRDVVLACPAYWMAGAAHKASYLAQYIISPARHASDTGYWNRVNSIQTSDPITYNGFTGAFASFFQTADPNAHKLTNSSTPGVPLLNSSSNARTSLFAIQEEFVIAQANFTNVQLYQFQVRCDFWRSVAPRVPI